MQYLECNYIFHKLIPSDIENHQQIAQNIADIHIDIDKYFSKSNPYHRDLSRGETTMTLRNFSATLRLIELGSLLPGDACSIVYLAQIPISDRKHFSKYFDRLGKSESLNSLRNELKNFDISPDYYAHSNFIKTTV
jgi:hypothetical protein